MTLAVRTIHDEIRDSHARAKAIIAKARTEQRDLTADEQGEYDRLSAQLEKLAKRQTRERSFDEMLALVNQHAVSGTLERNGHRPLVAVSGKSPGQAFVESEEYQALLRAGLTRGPREPVVVDVPLPGLLNADTPWISPPGGYPGGAQLPPVAPGAPVLLPRTAQLFARAGAPDGGTSRIWSTRAPVRPPRLPRARPSRRSF
jgi:hypothetical protein